MSALAPWLQRQLQRLLAQRGHALLLSGPSGLGQYDLGLALARTWLCEQPGAWSLSSRIPLLCWIGVAEWLRR